MRYPRKLPLVLAGALMLAATSAAPLLAQDKGGGDSQPVTLSLAVWDHPGRQAEQSALDLVALAPELSGGEISVSEPIWGASDAADLVRSGQVDLAILATREWSPLGVNSLDALEAPFLIDNDALAAAVATSDVADMAMADLGELGVTGLAMWPEDLRHLFGFGPFGRAFTTPGDVEGATILAISGAYGRELITTLGGYLYEEFVENDSQTGDRVLDAQSGALDGMVTGLKGAGLSTDQISHALVAGDVVLFPKFQMLVGNAKSLERLTDEQRAAFDSIVAEVHRLALGRQFTEAELAAEICALGGTVTEAGSEALAQLRDAAGPLADAMAVDPDVSDLITRITDLASEVERAPHAGPCGTGRAESAFPVSDTAGFLATTPPDGVYRADVSYEDLAAKGVPPEWARDNSGLFTISFTDGVYTFDHRHEPVCQGSYESLGTALLLTDELGGCAPGISILWRPDADGVALVLAGTLADPSEEPWSMTDFMNVQAHLEGRTWVKIDGPMPSLDDDEAIAAHAEDDFTGSELVPEGTYRAEMVGAEMEAAGAGAHYAAINDGTWTWTFVGDTWQAAHDRNSESCSGTIEVVDGNVRFLTAVSQGCGMDYDVRWRLDGADLSLRLADLPWTHTSADFANEQTFIDRVWTRIEEAD
jgi:TRAP-type C4-dicarboxylate transport system substrate-binding protein